MKIFNEKGTLIDHQSVEYIEQHLANKYIKSRHKVLELGARYGSVSIITNKIVEDKSSHFVVEPDSEVWEALEKNMKLNDCNFNIIKGVIGKNKYNLVGEGYSRRSIPVKDSSAEVLSTVGLVPPSNSFPLPDVDFNALIVDCEGFLEIFYEENKSLFDNLQLMIIECDEPQHCNYPYLFEEFKKLNFTIVEEIRAYCNYFVLIK
tara:strand:- start:823 stop:1437 length:615 start_codon:yes stop_codon:yes gene_type:complete